jgi:hypothetical protein
MPPTPPLASLYADAVAALYTAFLALDPLLSLDAATSLDAIVSAWPRRRLPRPQR